MTPQSVALMAEHNRWMNQRMYKAALSLPEADVVQERGAGFGSIYLALSHIAVGGRADAGAAVQHAHLSQHDWPGVIPLHP